MLSSPNRPEIDHRTLKLIVGLVALSLASLTSLFARTKIASISASYYESGWSQVIFIGFLFAISAFLFAYNGYSRREMLLSKIAAVAALCIALFPCGCGGHKEIIKNVHGIAAAVMFLILAFFCYVFFRRALHKRSAEAKSRAYIYAGCGVVMVVSILVLATDFLLHGAGTARIPRLTFYGEAAALVAFGVSWLVASHHVPGVTSKQERLARANSHNVPSNFSSDAQTA
jgi:hypothetical protein